MIEIQNNDTILFQGDSITDTDRERTALGPNDKKGLGNGYASMLAARLQSAYPGHDLNIFNRGISGNKVTDLFARWRRDALDLKPDLISILIGVNDTWHGMEGGIGVPVDRYEEVYRALLSDTRRALPNATLVLCEPFVLLCGVVNENWLGEIRARRAVVKQLAVDYGAAFVPFQSAFDEKLSDAPPDHWLFDGVHPSGAGHSVMADCWWNTVIGSE